MVYAWLLYKDSKKPMKSSQVGRKVFSIARCGGLVVGWVATSESRLLHFYILFLTGDASIHFLM